MKRAEFEEKSYEVPLCAQLYNSNAVFCPGQVYENLLGFDISGMVADPRVWRRIGFKSVPRAVRLSTYNLKAGHGQGCAMPDYPINLIIQAKRPCRLVRVPPCFRGKLLSPHYRIEFESRQHMILARLQRRLGVRAIVAYASPVFSDWQSLYDNISGGSLINNSTFPSLNRVGKHSAWLYDRPGSVGCGHSKPEFIEDRDLLGQIDFAKGSMRSGQFMLESTEAALVTLTADIYEKLGRLTRQLYLEGDLPFSRNALRMFRRDFGPLAAQYLTIQITLSSLGCVWAIA